MSQLCLAEIVTKDNFIHQGLYYKPSRPGKKAMLWVHGLTDNFYGDMGMVEALVDTLGKDGWGFAAFNNRGHDIVSSVKKLDSTSSKGYTSLTLGSGCESFVECVYDIDAGISFLIKQGFTHVVIAGSSTGANKVCYYAGTKKDQRVAGVILISPISDVPIESQSKQYKADVKRMKALAKQGKGETLLDSVSYLPLTPKRYLSLYDPGGIEDVFDYYSKQPKLTVFSRIKQPLCVVLAGADEYSDRPVLDILNVLKKHHRSTNFHGLIIPGALHSFGGKEKEVVRSIVGWITSL